MRERLSVRVRKGAQCASEKKSSVRESEKEVTQKEQREAISCVTTVKAGGDEARNE